MQIKDSGDRRKFNTGAVRDMSKGKGRCDLLPLRVIAKLLNDDILKLVNSFVDTRNTKHLYELLDRVMESKYGLYKSVLELSKHFEKGAEKYEIDNWKKGIPEWSFIDSAVRHYLKYLDEQDDENHFIAFIWNIVCLIWTVESNGGIDNKLACEICGNENIKSGYKCNNCGEVIK